MKRMHFDKTLIPGRYTRCLLILYRVPGVFLQLHDLGCLILPKEAVLIRNSNGRPAGYGFSTIMMVLLA